MDDTQEEHYNRFLKIDNFLGVNAADLAVNPALATEKVNLVNLIGAIDLQDLIANSDDTGYTATKNAAAATLRNLAKKVSRGLTSYFETTGDRGQLEKAKMTDSEIDYRDEAKLNLKANTLYAIGNQPAVKTDPLLATALLAPADIDALESARIAFVNLVTLPDEKRGDRKAANEEKARLFDEGNKELLPRIANFMLPFASADPVLYSKFETAYAIDNLGGSSDTSGYNMVNLLIPGNGFITFQPTSGPLPPALEMYFRAVDGSVFLTTTNLPASPGSSGWQFEQGQTLKDLLGNLGLDLSLTHLMFSNPAPDPVTIRVGVKQN